MTEVIDDVSVEEEMAAAETPSPEVEGGPLAFTIKKSAFQNALEKASHTVSSKDNEPLLKTFNIEADEDQVRILSTDLSLGSIAKIRVAEIKQPGASCVPAQKLISIVRAVEDGDVTFCIEDKQAVIAGGRARWQINALSAGEYPKVPRFDPDNAEEISRQGLLDAIQKTRYAASTDELRPSLMLIAFNGERAATSDGSRLQWFKFAGLQDVQIPIFAVNNLVRLLTRTEVETIKVELKEHHLLFQIGADTFSSQRLFEEFPDVEKVILDPAKTKNDKQLTIDKQILLDAVGRVRISADPEKKQLDLTVSEDLSELELRAVTGDGELATEIVPCTATVEAGRRLSVNHQFFLDALNMNPAKQVTLKLGPDEARKRSSVLMEEGDLASVLLQLRPEE